MGNLMNNINDDYLFYDFYPCLEDKINIEYKLPISLGNTNCNANLSDSGINNIKYELPISLGNSKVIANQTD